MKNEKKSFISRTTHTIFICTICIVGLILNKDKKIFKFKYIFETKDGQSFLFFVLEPKFIRIFVYKFKLKIKKSFYRFFFSKKTILYIRSISKWIKVLYILIRSYRYFFIFFKVADGAGLYMYTFLELKIFP